MQISGFLVTPLRTFRNTRGSGADGGRLDEFVGVTLGQNRSERLNPPLGEGSACAVRFVRLFRGSRARADGIVAETEGFEPSIRL